VASLQTRSCSSRASTRSATRLRGLQRIRADSYATRGCSWANLIRKPAPPDGRIVTTGSSPRPSPAGLVGTIALEESIVAQLERFGPSRLLNFGESTRSPRPRSSSVRACGMSPRRSRIASPRVEQSNGAAVGPEGGPSYRWSPARQRSVVAHSAAAALPRRGSSVSSSSPSSWGACSGRARDRS
jgi:hypothetical protein